MNDKIRNRHTDEKLRKRAEELLKGRPKNLNELSSDDIQSLIQELQVHQIELEIQNEELRRAQEELEESRNKYADLYDFAPVGYFTLDRNGIIQEANLTGSTLLGVERKHLVNSPFFRYVAKENRNEFHSCWKKFSENFTKQGCELKVVRGDGSTFYAQLECTAVIGVDEELKYPRVAVIDISHRKRSEEEFQRAHEELEIVVQRRTQELIEANKVLQTEIAERKRLSEELERSLAHLSKKNLYEVIIGTVTRNVHQSIDLEEVLENAVDALIRNVHGAEMVCIYLVEEEESDLPLKSLETSSVTYDQPRLRSAQAVLKAHRGCPDQFIEKVRSIPYPKGVTWETITNGTSKYCADVDQDTTIGPAGREAGIKSYLSVPISFEGVTVGTLNIASLEKNAFDEEELKLLETIRQQIEVAIRNAKQAEELRKIKEELELRVQERTKELTDVNQELIREVAWHKWAEKTLQSSEERYRALYEENPSMYFTINGEGKILSVNRFGAEWLGYNLYELVGQSVYNIIWKDNIKEVHEKLGECFKNPGQVFRWESGKFRKNGSIIWLREFARAVPGANGSLVAMVVSEDITERKQAEEQIKASLKEKGVLLKEIHHRVKNNLQIISSLLRLQSRHIESKKAREKFRESHNRIRSMALIHEKLYQSDDFEGIDFADYIRSLLSYLFSSYGVSPSRIKLRINAENIFMNIDKAIPCGLIVNEIVSNSLSHAFPGEIGGEIWVECREGGELIIGNNGVPFPENVDFRKTRSLGLQLVCVLVEQLRGNIELDRGGGTVFRIKCSQ
ncbi:MAG TPA: PAS domain S-box protein [Thermodesulfobacteriota bacterium]|nr:PAS domain S-box protein [Thermodesulfobacteriota bacterium]